MVVYVGPSGIVVPFSGLKLTIDIGGAKEPGMMIIPIT